MKKTESKFSMLIFMATIAASGCSTQEHTFQFLPTEEQSILPVSTSNTIQEQIDPSLISKITQIKLEPHTSGAIILAQGVDEHQGHYTGELTVNSFASGVLTLDFKSLLVNDTHLERPLTVATTISARSLRQLKKVVINAGRNTLVYTR